MKKSKLFFLFYTILMINVTGFAQLVHPGGWLNSKDLSRIREKVASGEEPWASAWEDIKNNGAGVNTKANVAATITSDGAFQDQGEDAFRLAIKWVVTGDKAYATAGINIIDAWAKTVKDFDIKNTPLRQGIGSNMMANAAEILAWGFNGDAGWAKEDVIKAQKWFKNVIYPYTSTGGSRSMNWGTSCLAGNMSMAVFCDNIDMYNDAIDAYKFGFTNTDDGCAGVTQYIVNKEGQCFESERDQSHAQGGIAHLVEPAMIAWNQGDNLVSYSNYRLVAGMEYSAKYNLGNDVPFVDDYPNPCGVNFSWMDNGFISKDDRGAFSPIYVMAATLFEYAGINHPYVNEIASSPDYFPEYTNSDHPGMGHLLYSRDNSVSTCKNTTALIEAECFDAMNGIETEACDEGTDNIGSIHAGDWVMFNNIDLTGMYSINARVASNTTGGIIEVRLGATDGTVIGSVEVANTKGWQTWITKSVNITPTTGVQDIYLVFKGSTGGLMNINWIGFSKEFICANTTAHIEAECYDTMSGIKTEEASEGTLNVGWINNGDWMLYNNLDLTGMKSVLARISGKTTGSTIEVRLGSTTGTLIATVPVTNTGGTQVWETDTVNLNAVATGTQNVYLVFKGGSGYLFNLNWFGFSKNIVCNNTVAKTEAECYDTMSGIKTEDASEGTLNVGWINNGDWMLYNNLNLTGMKSVMARIAGKTTGSTIEVRLGSTTGKLIATVPVTNTGGTQVWKTDTVNLNEVATGTQNVYLVFKGGSGYLYNLNWFGFSSQSLTTLKVNSLETEELLTIYPNPVSNVLNVELKDSTTVQLNLFNNSGQWMLSQKIEGGKGQVDLSKYPLGNYIVKITAGQEIVTKKIIKQ